MSYVNRDLRRRRFAAAGVVVASAVAFSAAGATAATAADARVNGGPPLSVCGTVSGPPSSNVAHYLGVTDSRGIRYDWRTSHAVITGGTSSLSGIRMGDVVLVVGTAPADGLPDADTIKDPASC